MPHHSVSDVEALCEAAQPVDETDSSARLRRLLWDAYADAVHMYERLHAQDEELFPYGGDVEHEIIGQEALWRLRHRLMRLAEGEEDCR